MGAKKELAYYYPNPFWQDGDWIKNLVLFFDGVAVLVPEYMRERFEQSDYAIVAGLREHGLLHIIDPAKAVNAAATEQLAKALLEVISSGALDSMTGEDHEFHELSSSRVGFNGDVRIARDLLLELQKRKLARDSTDGVSIPMHPQVRYLILILLSQILRPSGAELGAVLNPVTDSPQIVSSLEGLLSFNAEAAARGSVVSFDMNTVGVDVGSFPLDEVLSYKKENRKELTQYQRKVRLFATELSRLPAEARETTFEERQQELNDLSADLRKASRQAWRKPASFALSMTGAAWSALTGNPVGAMLSVSAAALGYSGSTKPKLGAYSYVFRAARRFRW
jgi:hypothetical protein